MKTLCLWGLAGRKAPIAALTVVMAKTLEAAVPGVGLTLLSAKQGESLKGILGRHGVQVSTVSSRNLVSVARALAKSDGLVITGAPFLESPYQGAGALAIVTLAKALGLPVPGYGISLFEYRTWWGKRLYRGLLNRIDRITVREPVARDILTSLGVRAPVDLFADFRFTLEPPPRETVRPLLAPGRDRSRSADHLCHASPDARGPARVGETYPPSRGPDGAAIP